MKKNSGAVAALPEESVGAITLADIKEVLEKARTKNVTYLLAGRLASVELAVEAGYLGRDMLVFAPALARFSDVHSPLGDSVSPSGLIQLGELMDAVIAELRTHPFADEGDSWWIYQNTLQLVLEAVDDEAFLRIC